MHIKDIMRMNKKIYTFLLAITLLGFALPTTVKAHTSLEMIEQDVHNVSISVYGYVADLQCNGCMRYEHQNRWAR